MSRRLKPYKVETVRHNDCGLHVDIYFDRNSQDFFGEFQGHKFRASSVVEVKKLAWDALDAWRPPEWKQVIHLDLDCEYTAAWSSSLEHGCALEFSFERLEVAESSLGNEIFRPFLPRGPEYDEPKPEQWALDQRERGQDWSHGGPGRDKTRIPYDEKTWQTLVGIKARTDLLIKRLSEILDDPKKLKRVGARLLKQLGT